MAQEPSQPLRCPHDLHFAGSSERPKAQEAISDNEATHPREGTKITLEAPIELLPGSPLTFSVCLSASWTWQPQRSRSARYCARISSERSEVVMAPAHAERLQSPGYGAWLMRLNQSDWDLRRIQASAWEIEA